MKRLVDLSNSGFYNPGSIVTEPSPSSPPVTAQNDAEAKFRISLSRVDRQPGATLFEGVYCFARPG
jgi:hypothetical protein